MELQAALDRGDQLVPTRAAADAVGVHAKTLRSWVDRGVLPAVVVGGVRCVLLDHAVEVERETRRGRRCR